MLVSIHDPNTVYHGSQHVNRSRDGGENWESISEDLSTNNPAHQDQSGGPINADVTGVEIFGVVFSIAESPTDATEIWAGSDDGRLHISRDDGASWTDITPPDMPENGTVDEIDVSRHAPGRAYVAVQAYRLDDFTPYIFRTDDWGGSWSLVTDGIPGDYPVRTVREDPVQEGLVFAGTEFGLYVSLDGGAGWQSLQQNLPITPVTGMRAAHDDLIISTQGRSFWILDDITPLREIASGATSAPAHLFTPRDAWRVNNGGGGLGLGELEPQGIPQGGLVHYWLAADAEEVRLEVLNTRGELVKGFSSDSTVAADFRTDQISAEAGLNRTAWDLFYPGPETPDDAVIWGYTGGIKAPPGAYALRLSVDGEIVGESTLNLRADPRIPEVAQADYEEQLRVGLAVRDSINQVTDAIETLISVREQVESVMESAAIANQDGVLQPLADTLSTNAQAVHEELMQTNNRSGQDPIRFPPRLDNQLVELYNYVTGVDGYISGGREGRPASAAYRRFDDLNADWAAVRGRYQAILIDELERFNELVESLGLPAIVLSRDGRLIS